jgi:hypothetical protein
VVKGDHEADIERMRVRGSAGCAWGWDAVAEHSTVGAHVRDRGFMPLLTPLVLLYTTSKLQYSRRKQAMEETGQ